MSLNYDLTHIKDHKRVCWVDNRLDPATGKATRGMSPLTESLIFACMAIELGEITARNTAQFHERLSRWELVNGNFLGDRGSITLEQVQLHVGLQTNVCDRSRASFEKKLALVALDRALAFGRRREMERTKNDEKKAKRSDWRKKHNARKGVIKENHADQAQEVDEEGSARQED